MDKQKVCFIIMPISDVEGYTSGHFRRVYEYLIKPSCELAGFKPIRADDVQTTNMIALDIVKQIISADMALCDLSARNPNVLYELGIRQAFNKPVTLIKDLITPRIFDISGFRDIEYDQSLRIDTVQSSIDNIAETIKNTYDRKGSEINSLISLLGIEAASVDKKVEISEETALMLNAVSNLERKFRDFESRIPASIDSAYSITSFVPPTLTLVSDFKDLQVADRIWHNKYGYGVIIDFGGTENNPVATIKFDGEGEKKIMLNYAKLYQQDIF